MNTSEIQHFSLNRILLLSVGLWPYNQSNLVSLQQILLFGIQISFVIYQVIIFFITEFTTSLAITICSIILIYTICIIKYNSFLINGQAVKYLLEQFIHVCNELKDENEIDVMKRYASSSKRYTTRLILVYVSLPIGMLMTMWPYILNIVAPRNESRSNFWISFLTEHFANKNKYRYLMLLYANATFCIGSITLLATGTMLIGYIKYACGMFRIASYRIKRALTINKTHKSFKNEIMIHKEIICAMDVHRQAMKLCKYFTYNFNGTFFMLVIVGVVILSLNLYRTFQCVSDNSDKQELILHVEIVIISLVYMFIANYIAQEITDHNNDVFITVYNGHWYVAPLHIQKIVLFLLQVGNKTFGLSCGGLFTGSLYTFATLVNTSMSYFTVLYSTQKL
ncbi:uncharacterized protein LOC105194078 [Solenopsis invicta]|uniref:uncharacterized protein LOC105194078 n=1 Tax=Solenopsis invicta TaxID=13686 RepID=UPI00193EAB63|nr:uncharacterized protein LOC105194078 [Solenopsis invicta]